MNRILYSLHESDFQDVAEARLKRKLTKKELERAVKIFGNAFDWYESVALAIDEVKNPTA